VLAITPNLDLLLDPLKRLFAHIGRLRHVTFIALVYPAYQRFRTSVGLALFSLVCFTMVVMACVAASTTQHFSNLNAMASDYDIIGQPLFTPFNSLDQMRTKLAKTSPTTAADLTAVSSAASLPIGVIQPDAAVARWQLYPIAAIQGDFLNGVGLPLVARADGFQHDSDVWNAVRAQPGNVVIDVGALQSADIDALGAKPPPPITLEQYAAPPIASALLGPATLETVLNRPDTQDLLKKSPPEVRALLTDPAQLQAYTLKLSDVLTPAHTFKPTKLWLADFRGGAAHQVTVVGLVDNAYGQRYGLLGSPQTFAPIEENLPNLGNAYYYFQLKAGANTQTVAHAIGSALLDNGFETTVIHQALLDLNAPRVFASKVIERLVSLMLLVGTAALMVTGMRSVVERRQQIGMLRALGFHQLHIQALFILESLFVAASGAFIGLILGVALCSNAFAANVFQQSQATLALVIPWNEIAIIEIIAVAAALIAVALPAWQAGRITPAEALHYE
ncbi:MAG TPA: FtsX-like permease family protein, partial [Ktedonobacterales bacterium]|nr:FtsX-like permease family protein [Ktedonobacterales bacterium]